MTFHIPSTDADTKHPAYLVSAFDLALDEDASDVDLYDKTLDLRHMRAKPGETLARFEFHACAQDVSDRIELADLPIKYMWACYYAACVPAIHDVMIDGKAGISNRHQLVPALVRAEIGERARKLCAEVAPDFFGASQLTSADDSASSTSGATSPAEEQTATQT